MSNKVSFNIYLAMTENGAWIVTENEEDVLSDLKEQVGDYDHARIVKVTVSMAPPMGSLKMQEVFVDSPDEVAAAA